MVNVKKVAIKNIKELHNQKRQKIIHKKPINRLHAIVNVVVELFDQHGQLKEKRMVHNLITTVGKNHVADQMSDQGEAQMSHMAIGTGNTPADPADTTLDSELDRNALTSATQTGGNTVVYIGDWAAGDGTGAIVEAGIFNAGAGGTLLCRSVFSVVNKGAADILKITWTLTFS